jgi:hypothetical protein
MQTVTQGPGHTGQGGIVVRRLPILAAAVVLTLLSVSSTAYGSSPPLWSHTVPGPPAWMQHEAARSPVDSWTPLSLVSALAGGGAVQGHIFDYAGGPVAGATVWISAHDGTGTLLWEHKTSTDAAGFYSVSDAPATDLGRIVVETKDGKVLFERDLVFADPGTSTYDVRPGRLLWEAYRGGPWGLYWGSATVEVAGLSATGAPVYTQMTQRGLPTNPDISPVASWAWALPADARLAALSYYPDEVSLWDVAEPPEFSNPVQPIPVVSGGESGSVVQFVEDKAYRIFFTNSYWASGKPGTALRLAMQNFKQGMTLEFDGASQAPNGVSTTWGDRSYTTTGPLKQTVSLTIPATVTPGYDFDVSATEPVVRYGTFYLGLSERFQVCTLNSTKLSVKRGGAIRLSGVIPTQGHVGAKAGIVKYVTLFKRTTAASAAPSFWDPTHHGWTKVVGPYKNGTFKASGLGKYLTGYLRPSRTTWYVVRYPGDSWYWRAYTSVLKVRVY